MVNGWSVALQTPGRLAEATAAECCGNCLPVLSGWLDGVLLLQWQSLLQTIMCGETAA